MAVLNKIRQRSIFLIAIIALALFAFILSDLFRNSSALTGGSQDTIATVNGEIINREDFANKVEIAQRNQGPNGSSMQAINRVWDQELRSILLQEQYEELGLSVETDQMRQLWRNNLENLPEFQNEFGIYDEGKLNEFIANLKAISPERVQLGGSFVNYQDWLESEKSIATRGLEQTYFNLIKAGIASTLGEAEVDYKLENETIDLRFVNIPYAKIADSLVTVSKSEIADYIKKHPKQYEVEASRDINFVEFKETPSLEDEDAIQENVMKQLNTRVEYNDVSKLNDTIRGFKETNDVANFINTYSDVKYNDNFVRKTALPESVRDTLYNLNVGEYYGPYKDNGMVKYTKLVAEKTIPDSVKVRHILIPYAGAQAAKPEVTKTEEEAKKTADSVLAIVKKDKSKFPELVTALSSDQGSVEKGGEYDYHPYNTMVPEFNDFEFEGQTGDMDVVKTAFGFHIIEILGQKETSRLVKVATLAQKIEASDATIDKAFSDVSNFEIALQKKDFQKVAEENSLEIKQVQDMKLLDENLPGVGSQRPIVKWAFDEETEVGDTKRFSIPGGGYVVVQLSNANDKGLMSTEAASATALPEIRKEKKAKMLREKITGKTLEEIAKNQNVAVLDAKAVNLKNPTISGTGVEPKVVGAAFGLKVGEMSKPIDGAKGVYIVEVTNKNEAPTLDNYQAIANRLTTSRSGTVNTKVFNALKDAADIDDNRSVFY